jgi:hypothetical protein
MQPLNVCLQTRLTELRASEQWWQTEVANLEAWHERHYARAKLLRAQYLNEQEKKKGQEEEVPPRERRAQAPESTPMQYGSDEYTEASAYGAYMPTEEVLSKEQDREEVKATAKSGLVDVFEIDDD